MGLWGINMQVTDKMIKAALESWFGEPVTEPYDEHVDNMRFAIQAAIQAAWVSVDEALPPRLLGNVLVLNGLDYHVAEYLHDEKKWFNGDVYLYDVTHWMPLPEFKE
jgi:hypothetical protein